MKSKLPELFVGGQRGRPPPNGTAHGALRGHELLASLHDVVGEAPWHADDAIAIGDHDVAERDADDADGDGLSRRLPLQKLAMEIHLWAIAALVGPVSGLSSVARKPASRHQDRNCACV